MEQQQHPDLRKQAPVQFEGEVNPFTGEVGGPKRDPFVAGDGDWQYSGRVTVSLCVHRKARLLMASVSAGLLNAHRDDVQKTTRDTYRHNHRRGCTAQSNNR